jgi:uncharacterized protein (TIGR03083 family)
VERRAQLPIPTSRLIGQAYLVSDLEAYLAVQRRLSGIVRPDNAMREVRFCPGWNVGDVVAHLTGLCEDWVDGRLDGYASEAWTASQVARYAGWDVAVVMRRWRELLTDFAALGPVEGFGEPARWALGDAVTHEADIRETVGAPELPAEAVDAALKGAIARWRMTLAEAHAPTVLLRVVDGRDWWLGTHDDPDALVAGVMAYEVLRAAAGRRSRMDVRAWTWSGDPEPVLAAGLPYPFRWTDAVA